MDLFTLVVEVGVAVVKGADQRSAGSKVDGADEYRYDNHVQQHFSGDNETDLCNFDGDYLSASARVDV